ncbi:hypothetical protein, partial [Escherichia coli]|uniref:hypothetical protein n=1 Tax=Escherichia coli TaxID=562 RepID=UPI0027396AAF
VVQTVASWSADLVEERRRVRIFIVVAAALYGGLNALLHLAIPGGDKFAAGPREFALAGAAGFKTAVTTRPGMIYPESADHMTALQRV